MITEKEVQQAIQECMREPVTGNKRAVLADLIIIQEYLFGQPNYSAGYSYSSKAENTIHTKGGTEFLEIVDGKNPEKVWSIIDELMETIKTLHPRMYDRILDKISDF